MSSPPSDSPNAPTLSSALPVGPSPAEARAFRWYDWVGSLFDAKSIYSDIAIAQTRSIALAMFAAWLGVVSFLVWTHLVWRDEVKALLIAIQGTVFGVFKELHWEGHPALWYLLLRAAHALVPRPEVLLLVSTIVAAAAMLVLVLRAPFSLPLLALILVSRFSIFEYSVMARNYGISMLLLFLFAALYERHRDKDCWLGVLLFLLANCNIHSVLLVGGLLLFWLVDILCADAANRARNIRMFIYNTVIAVVGVVACILTIYPPLNDLAMIDHRSVTSHTLIRGLLLPSRQFSLSGAGTLASAMPRLGTPIHILVSLVLFGSTLGLIRRTGAFLAALTTLVGFSLFFVIVYHGEYRHQALWLVFLICMYWLAAPSNAQKEPDVPVWLKPSAGLMSTIGTLLFVLVLLVQLPDGAKKIIGIVRAPVAALYNRSNNVSSILAGHAGLQQAVFIADPDYFLETLPYYVSNPTYLMREQRYGNIVHFSRKSQLELSLGDVLTNARRLRHETGRPVVILLAQESDPSLPPQVYWEIYNWNLTTTPEQEREFQLSTRLLSHHIASNETDESYYAYVMDN